MTHTTQHIGIVGCSAEGAALCYQTICVEGAKLLGPHAHPEVSMHTPSLSDYMVHIYRNDWQGVGEVMLASAHKLAKIGADFLVCPDNTIHQALPFIEPRSPLPWLHIAGAWPTRPRSAASAASASRARAGWSTARSTPRSCRRAGSNTFARPSKSATRSPGSSWTSWSAASSNPRRLPPSSA
jgi:hypothetical protein